MRENIIVLAIQRYLKTLENCFFWKEHGGLYGTAGIPDIICCLGGMFVAFEVKNETGEVTRLQEATLRKIRTAGGVAVVVRSVEDVKDVIHDVLNRGGVRNGR